MVTSHLISLFMFGNLPTALGQDSSLKHPWKLLEAHQPQILLLSSDQEALEFNQRLTPKSRSAESPPTRRKQSREGDVSIHKPTEIQEAITTFWASMTAIANIQKLRTLTESPLNGPLVLEDLLSEAQQKWIFSKFSLEGLEPLLEFQKKLSQSPFKKPTTFLLDDEYSKFSNFHDHSIVISDGPSWTNILNEFGFKGIESRLSEYWPPSDQHSQNSISNTQKQAYIQQYVTSRLMSIFHGNLLMQALQVETQAYKVAWESWHHLQQGQQQRQSRQARMRLCGTWKWIIHNHQNHGDHKTMMTFTPPENATPSHVQPTTVFMHGDTLYLKWIFPQGIQEDSLLFSNHDTRLEGTFTNSVGPYGSISGQRLSPCKK